jgi:hypothetical protein
MLPRRNFLKTTAAVTTSGLLAASSYGRVYGNQLANNEIPPRVTIELPRNRVPLSFIIDDSTCLVNMGKYCMPQFAATYPEREEYKRPWREWPHEIPDSFVRLFGEWCGEHGVKGKYSIVPNPACVGWLDRELPGWSRKELEESLQLVRTLMLPNWDIHPEMITHTRAIDLTTGRPFADYSPEHMENTYPQRDVSVDYLASYIAYALQILKNCELPCEGITTPGGFGNNVKEKLPLAVFQAVRDVYGAQLPHYFKYVEFDDNVAPRLEARSTSASGGPEMTVNIPAGTDDWFGGWDGYEVPRPERFTDADARTGRMVELIEKRLPAIMLCHWPGMYCNGQLTGFHAFQQVVEALDRRFKEQTLWMKLTEIGRYYAAQDATELQFSDSEMQLDAPFACPQFTLRLRDLKPSKVIVKHATADGYALDAVSSVAALQAGNMVRDNQDSLLCFDLAEGTTVVQLM